MQTVAEYNKIELDKGMLVESLKGGVLGAGVVFSVDFLLSKFLKNGKIRAAVCAAAPVALAMWLKEKNPELASSIAIGGAGAGIYKLIQAFLYERLHIPYSGELEEYGVLEEVPVNEEAVQIVETPSGQNEAYGILEEVPEEEEVIEVSPSYGATTV